MVPEQRWNEIWVGAGRSVTAGQRLHILGANTPQGDGTCLAQIYSFLPGADSDWKIGQSLSSPAKPLELTTGSFTLGADNPATDKILNATVYRIACWAGPTVPDIRDPEVRAAFVSADGTLILNPSVSRSRSGSR